MDTFTAAFAAFQRTMHDLRTVLGRDFFEADSARHTETSSTVLHAYNAMALCAEEFVAMQGWTRVTPELCERMQELDAAAARLYAEVQNAPEDVAIAPADGARRGVS
uniref:Uncharacterized protein n=1 Tax=viral metagenome TaxID=1070528 RepID=A0A6C0AT77_9ZZZZ